MSSNDSPPPLAAAAAAGSSPNDPNPPAGGTGPGGRPPPEGRSASSGDQPPSSSQGNPEPTIWDSIDDLKQHPLLYISAMITKENIDLCLSTSYDDLDSKEETDHKKVLMSLPGKFKVGPHDQVGSYAVADFNDLSVVFEEGCVQMGTDYFASQLADRELNQELIGELLRNQSILNYIAFFQEVIEHELGHLKYHLEGAKDDNGGKDDRNSKVDTPKKLRYEAGFQANAKIRLDNFPDDTFEKRKYRVLEVKRRNHAILILRWTPKNSADQYLQKHGAEAKGQDLLDHMNYPKARRCGGSKRKREDEDHSFNPPDNEPSTDKGGDGDGDGDVGGDSKPSPFKRSVRPWIESVAHYLPIANAAYETTIEKEKPQYETSSDGKDPLFALQDILLDPSIDLPLKDCDVEVVTCDENRKEKTEFSPQETIWVKIFVRSNSKKTIGIPIAPGPTFGRSGVKVLIKGAEKGRTTNTLCKGLEIKPSESYTFFRILAKPKDDYSVEYAALSPGRYKASVSGIRGGSISFLFSVADKSSDASTSAKGSIPF